MNADRKEQNHQALEAFTKDLIEVCKKHGLRIDSESRLWIGDNTSTRYLGALTTSVIPTDKTDELIVEVWG